MQWGHCASFIAVIASYITVIADGDTVVTFYFVVTAVPAPTTQKQPANGKDSN